MSEPFVEDIDKIRELTIQLAKNCQFRIECGFLVIGHPFAQQNPVMVNVAGKIKHFNIADDKGNKDYLKTLAKNVFHTWSRGFVFLSANTFQVRVATDV